MNPVFYIYTKYFIVPDKIKAIPLGMAFIYAVCNKLVIMLQL